MKDMRFAHWLKTQRLARKLTQEQLEGAAKLPRKAVSKYERGETTLPDDDTRDRIHEALGTSERDLVELGVLNELPAPDGAIVYIAAERASIAEPRGAYALHTDAGEIAAITDMLKQMPDDAVQHLRRFLEAIAK